VLVGAVTVPVLLRKCLKENDDEEAAAGPAPPVDVVVRMLGKSAPRPFIHTSATRSFTPKAAGAQSFEPIVVSVRSACCAACGILCCGLAVAAASVALPFAI